VEREKSCCYRQGKDEKKIVIARFRHLSNREGDIEERRKEAKMETLFKKKGGFRRGVRYVALG